MSDASPPSSSDDEPSPDATPEAGPPSAAAPAPGPAAPEADASAAHTARSRFGGWPGWAPRPPRPPARRRSGWRRLLPTWRLVLVAGAVALVALLGSLVAGYLLVDIPEPKSAAAAQSNVYLYADGSQLARVGEIDRENVALDDVPEHVRHATLAAEDRDFYHAPPVDVGAMARAGWNMMRGGGRQSGSTITQQYVKNYYLDQRQTVTRKVKELFIAVKLDREVSKDEILEGYLNTSYFGRNAYGIQAAAHAYYGKPAKELNVAEGAYLAALLNSPNAYDVRANPGARERAEARWEYVLDGMVSEGWLEEDERERTRFPEPRDQNPSAGLDGERGYLVEAVKQHLEERGVVDEHQLAAGGYRITTTIEPARQRALTDAVDAQLETALSEEREQDSWVRAGASSVDTETGHVVAMYGGRDYVEQYVNNATRRDYQAASTFKPFVYAAALENDSTNQKGELIGPSTKYDGRSGREVVSRDGSGTGWAPENEGNRDYDTVPVSEGMDKSINAVFAQMGVDVGPELVRDTAVALGLPEATPGLTEADASISLGTATPSTLDMAGAYATLARHGEHREVLLVSEITKDGETVDLPEPERGEAISREAADGTTAMLEAVVRGGTGTAAASSGRPSAGKTGTAENDRAAWFAGYTPELATVVAIFGQDPETGAQRELYGAAGQERISGGGFPARIWGQYTQAALEGQPVTDFELHQPERREHDDSDMGSDEDDPDSSSDPDSEDDPDADPDPDSGSEESEGPEGSTGPEPDRPSTPGGTEPGDSGSPSAPDSPGSPEDGGSGTPDDNPPAVEDNAPAAPGGAAEPDQGAVREEPPGEATATDADRAAASGG
ncbi:Membrane carboxypeptidase (penicillin-binding protein) [Streptomyces zhaozhouensis]|uniref:Membrane carboxypeptidase (Penicillin-binding protein) n=1 Tax=Streptomyces zhaozhouensis TaxID=1300267 RepID=A0A286E2F1_9ACTN|nr:transglycosylase domain-containing protein [Streptomyces zhaozhouensis]SOD65075.1 Membrane carboxypeptidase (penicillin-binding protein) [Streptomyces zhaozhouensis]